LPNGKKNEYYTDEEARLSGKFCIDPRCAVNTNPEDPDETNEAEITSDTEKLKKIDARIKNELYKVCGIDDDDKEKYVPIHRKPVKSKKPTVNDREKFYTVKAKFDWKNGVEDPTSSLLTEFYSVDSETKNWKTAKLLNTNSHISLTEIEKAWTLNSEVQPVLQFVKVWTQSTGAWGVTIKLKMLRLMKTEYTQRGNAAFLNSDDEDEPATTPVVKKQVATVVDESDSDEESDDEPQQVAPVKTQPAPTTKKVAVVESDSDEESEEEVKPVKKAQAKAPAKSKKASA